jgi:hypothetical protein
MSAIRAFCERVALRVETLLAKTPPHIGAGLAAAAGLLLLVLSSALNLFDVTYDTKKVVQRQVGYFYCLNWSVVYTIVFPITFYFILSAYQRVPHLVGDLVAKGMIRHFDTMEIAEPKEVSGIVAESHPYFTTLGVVLGVVISYVEVILANIIPLCGGAWDPSNPANDWGEAALIRRQGFWHLFANGGFDLAAFSLQAFALSVTLVFFFWFFDLAHRLPLALKLLRLLVTPDPRSRDSRRGFEVFQQIVEPLLYASIGAYAMCYLSRSTKLFFTTSKIKHIGDFVMTEFGKAYVWPPNPSAIFAIKPEDVAPPPDVFGMLVTMAGFILLAIVAIVLAWVLRELASDGRSEVFTWLNKNPRSVLPGPNMPARKTTIDRLEKMSIWPLGYPPLNAFAFTLLIFLFSLVAYRTLILVGAYAIVVIASKYIAHYLKSKKSDNEPPDKPTSVAQAPAAQAPDPQGP